MLEDMKLGELLNLVNTLNGSKTDCKKDDSLDFWKIGKSYFIRTVTMHVVGQLKAINSKELVLVQASWVADSGRFHNALKDGDLNEVEPFVDEVLINRECIVDATYWAHVLPDSQK